MNKIHRKVFVQPCLIAAVLMSLASAQEPGAKQVQASTPETTTTVVKNAPAEAPTVRTASGILRGMTAGDISIFKGIPYAAAPIGAYRWRSPQPLPAWEGVRDATRFGADCAHAGFSRDSTSIPTNSSEDCLFINVWRPSGALPGAKLPVMVWIHGGAFVFGSGALPDNSGVQFGKQGIILVAFNYRLGRLGFFAFPA